MMAISTRSRPPTCPDENELVLLADGGLADKRRASIDRHLDSCATCTLLVAELAGMAAPERPVPMRYQVIRQLGAGAMGVVWEAEDKHLGRRVALKFVRTTDGNAPTTREARRERRSRLYREARALAQLRHPNVVSVYDVGESADELFLALELVIGTDARTWRALQPRTTADILGVWRQVATGLAAVHRAYIVHRDIKPDNVLVAEDGRVLLGDFGLATDRSTAVQTATNLISTGAILGTPIYMAYEQLVGGPATHKSDQYALCASIWEALAGTRPFVGPTLGAIATAMQARPVLPPNLRAADHHIFSVLVRGLDPDPEKRWPNIDALLAAFGGTSQPRCTSRAIWLAIGAASVAAAATVAVLAWRESSSSSATGVANAPATPAWTTTPDARRADLRTATPTERANEASAAACLQRLASLPSPTVRDEARCHVDAGDCSTARTVWRKAMPDETFATAFPRCPR
ncbi:MAG: protein kinase [Myxococcota bacterium]|nr:protein kinase [Myxococcota bacterium]